MRGRSIRHASPFGTAHRAFTLIELMVAMSAYTIIVGIVVIAMQLMSRAHPAFATAQPIAGATATALELAADIRYAISFSRVDASSVEFTVVDLNGDGVDEKIAYEWSGLAGAPLLRTLNGSASDVVLEDVHDFRLIYELTSGIPEPLDEELALLKYHDDAPGGHFHDFKLGESEWCAQYFLPDLPVDVTEWKLKRIRFMAKREGSDGNGIFEVWVTSASNQLRPTGEVLDYSVVNESDLDDSYTWVDVEFTALNSLDASAGLCIVFAQVTPEDSAATIPYNHGGDVMTPVTHWTKTSNFGSSWSDPDPDKDLRFFVFGTYDNYEPSAPKYVTGVTCHVQSGSDATQAAVSTVRIMNAPGLQP